uniref:Transcobalamin II n=1 Tax=Astyanax mexicanus TaxID=7994 RepID=A0A8B9H2S8_ASTMX
DPTAPDHDELILRLNKDLLRSVEEPEAPPNPSVHLALRLSAHHNLAMENQHLTRLKNQLHQNLQSSLAAGQAVTGQLALYVLALRSSCHDLTSLTLSDGDAPEHLLSHLKRQLEREKEHIALSRRPLTTYYQYSLGMLALCVGGVRVSAHVSHKLIHAVNHGLIKHGDSAPIGELTRSDPTVTHSDRDLEGSGTVWVLEESRWFRSVLQALQVIGGGELRCSAPMEALRSDARRARYHSPMALSQTLPALQQRTYLHLRGGDCRNEDDSLVLDDEPVVEVLADLSPVPVQVEVLKADGSAVEYRFEVPSGSTLLEVLKLLQDHQMGFTFETENSLWGKFLSRVNGEQARQTDRRYWNLSTDGTNLTQGMEDFNITANQKITIKNTGY